jgi:hypothetical protein
MIYPKSWHKLGFTDFSTKPKPVRMPGPGPVMLRGIFLKKKILKKFYFYKK